MLTPKMVAMEALGPGRNRFHHGFYQEVATPASAIRSPRTSGRRPRRCPASSRPRPVVFCGLFPVDAAELRGPALAMGKLRLNDASSPSKWNPPQRSGLGFRCGFLGLLPSRNHPGAFGARIDLESDRDGTLGVYKLFNDRWHGARASNPATCRTWSRSPKSTNRGSARRS